MVSDSLCFQAVQNRLSSHPSPSTRLHECAGQKLQVERKSEKEQTTTRLPLTTSAIWRLLCAFFLVLFPGRSSLHTSGGGGGDHCGFIRVKPRDIREPRSGHECKNEWFYVWILSHFVHFSCQECVTISAVMMDLLACSQAFSVSSTLRFVIILFKYNKNKNGIDLLRRGNKCACFF